MTQSTDFERNLADGFQAKLPISLTNRLQSKSREGQTNPVIVVMLALILVAIVVLILEVLLGGGPPKPTSDRQPVADGQTVKRNELTVPPAAPPCRPA